MLCIDSRLVKYGGPMSEENLTDAKLGRVVRSAMHAILNKMTMGYLGPHNKFSMGSMHMKTGHVLEVEEPMDEWCPDGELRG